MIEAIGEGGMGQVYRVTCSKAGKTLALKVLLDHIVTGTHTARFLREIAALKALQHPHIVRLLDHGWEGARPFYVMEFIAGPTARSLVVESGGQPEQLVLTTARQLTDALAYAHGQGLLHRDIKPSNVLLSWSELDGMTAKLLDFGLVRDQQAGAARITADGMLLGTPGYIPPEGISSSRDLDARSDNYALAMVTYYLRTGTHLFRPADVVCPDAHAKARDAARQRLETTQAFSREVREALLGLVAYAPAERPPLSVLQRALAE